MQQVQLINVVKTQFQYKLRTHISMLSTLMLYQIIFIALGILLSSTSFGSGNETFSLSINEYSANNVIGVTMIWSFIAGVILTKKSSKEIMNNFVVNKKSNHLANGLFILLMSVFAGITAFLSHFIIASGVSLIYGVDFLTSQGDLLFNEVFSGIIITILYILLISVIGYLLGGFAQVNKGITIVVIVLCLFGGSISEVMDLYIKVGSFYYSETNIILFSVKILITTAVLFIVAMSVGKRLEVR